MLVEFTLMNWVAILIIYLAMQNLCKTKCLIMGKPLDRPEIAGFKLLTSPAAMDFLVKTDNKGSRRYGTFSIDS